MIASQESREVRVKKIKVCMGPGCEAWDSQTILEYLEDQKEASQDGELLRVSPVSCLNKCGGGVSVKVACGRGILKLRRPEDMVAYIKPKRYAGFTA